MTPSRTQLDNMIRIASGKRAIEKPAGKSKRFHDERYLLSDGSILHVNTKSGRITLTDASLKTRKG